MEVACAHQAEEDVLNWPGRGVPQHQPGGPDGRRRGEHEGQEMDVRRQRLGEGREGLQRRSTSGGSRWRRGSRCWLLRWCCRGCASAASPSQGALELLLLLLLLLVPRSLRSLPLAVLSPGPGRLSAAPAPAARSCAARGTFEEQLQRCSDAELEAAGEVRRGLGRSHRDPVGPCREVGGSWWRRLTPRDCGSGGRRLF